MLLWKNKKPLITQYNIINSSRKVLSKARHIVFINYGINYKKKGITHCWTVCITLDEVSFKFFRKLPAPPLMDENRPPPEFMGAWGGGWYCGAAGGRVGGGGRTGSGGRDGSWLWLIGAVLLPAEKKVTVTFLFWFHLRFCSICNKILESYFVFVFTVSKRCFIIVNCAC